MDTKVIESEWELLTSFLPEGWEAAAKETGAMRRSRGQISCPSILLRVLLMHTATGLSLQQTAARAKLQDIAEISDVGLLKRLRSSEGWLRELARKMFERSRFSQACAQAPMGRRLRAVDATTVQEPGATGTSWRVHYCIGIPDMRCDFYQISDVKGGESYKRLCVERGDVILADRGYCHREGVAHIMDQNAEVIVRLNSTSFPLLYGQDNEKAFDMLLHLRELKTGQAGEWPVGFKFKSKVYDGRLCAMRKSAVAAEIAKKKAINEAKKKQRAIRAETLEFAEYVFIFTNVGEKILNVSEVLELYRARWQIELCFKRFKSLLSLGHLPKKTDTSARAWIEGKLLAVMLIEQLVDEANFFSPWGFRISS